MPLPPTPRAVITGAASGLGRAFALQVARRSGHLLLSDINDEGLAETARFAREIGALSVYTTRTDVSQLDEIKALHEKAEKDLGKTDLLVNNAGVGAGGTGVGETSIEDWHWVLQINLQGVLYGCHTFLPNMRNRRSGHIINVASIAGLLCVPNMGPYNVSKAGVIALSETLAGELLDSGVGVSVLCPGFFPTNVVRHGRITEDAKKRGEKLMSRSALNADDVARFAMQGADRGDLYLLPHQDTRWLWRTKRVDPQRFHKQVLPRFDRRRVPG